MRSFTPDEWIYVIASVVMTLLVLVWAAFKRFQDLQQAQRHQARGEKALREFSEKESGPR
jgi:hypothetical protein